MNGVGSANVLDALLELQIQARQPLGDTHLHWVAGDARQVYRRASATARPFALRTLLTHTAIITVCLLRGDQKAGQ